MKVMSTLPSAGPPETVIENPGVENGLDLGARRGPNVVFSHRCKYAPGTIPFHPRSCSDGMAVTLGLARQRSQRRKGG